MLQPENGLKIKSFFKDPKDTELTDIIPCLKLMAHVKDVRPVMPFVMKFFTENEFNFTNVEGIKMKYNTSTDTILLVGEAPVSDKEIQLDLVDEAPEHESVKESLLLSYIVEDTEESKTNFSVIAGEDGEFI